MKNYNKIEKHIADSLRNEQVDWDKGAMWQSIESALPPEEDTTRKPFAWIWIGALLLVAVAAIAVVMWTRDDKITNQNVVVNSAQAYDEVKEENESAKQNENHKENGNSVMSLAQTKAEVNKKNKIQDQNTNGIQNQNTRSSVSPNFIESNVKNEKTFENLSENLNEELNINLNEDLNEDQYNSLRELQMVRDDANHIQARIKEEIENKILPEIDHLNRQELEIENNIPITPFIQKSKRFESFSSFEPLVLLPLHKLKTKSISFREVEPLKRKSAALSLSATAGVYRINRTFKNGDDFDFLVTKENAETVLHGLSGGLLLHYKFNKKWQISSGLDYLQINERLDWEQEEGRTQTMIVSDSAAFYLEGTERTYLVGEVDQTEIQLRKILHYNTVEQINIPIQLSYISQFNKLEVLLSAGFNLNLINSVNGRFINNATGGFSEIKNAGLDYKKIGVNSYRLGISAQYPVSHNLKLNFGFEHRQLLQSITKDLRLPDQRYRLLGLQAGLLFSL